MTQEEPASPLPPPSPHATASSTPARRWVLGDVTSGSPSPLAARDPNDAKRQGRKPRQKNFEKNQRSPCLGEVDAAAFRPGPGRSCRCGVCPFSSLVCSARCRSGATCHRAGTNGRHADVARRAGRGRPQRRPRALLSDKNTDMTVLVLILARPERPFLLRLGP